MGLRWCFNVLDVCLNLHSAEAGREETLVSTVSSSIDVSLGSG